MRGDWKDRAIALLSDMVCCITRCGMYGAGSKTRERNDVPKRPCLLCQELCLENKTS